LKIRICFEFRASYFGFRNTLHESQATSYDLRSYYIDYFHKSAGVISFGV